MPDIRVLVVEEEQPLRESMVRALRQRPLEVQSAATLAEARVLLETGRFDVLFVNSLLPDGRGLDLYRDFREKFQAARFVLMSGRDAEDLGDALQESLSFLPKPFRTHDMIKLVPG